MGKYVNVVTSKHFDLFVKECEKWQQRLSLLDWEIMYEHQACEGPNRGEAFFSTYSRCATIRLNTKWNRKVTGYNICKCAFHEMCELLLGELNDIGTNKRAHTLDDVVTEVHRVIRVLENTLFKMSLSERISPKERWQDKVHREMGL